MSDTSFTSKALNTALPIISSVPANLVGAIATGISGVSGIWNYVVTPFNGGEGMPSTALNYVHSFNSGVRVYFDAVANATDYRLYRSGAGYTGYVLVDNSTSSPLIDTFTASGGYLTSVNTTNSESRALSSSPTKFYQVAAGRTLLKEALLANSYTDTLYFSLYVVPSGDAPCAGNVLFNAVSLETNETKILSLNTVLEQGDSIQAYATEIGMVPGFGCVSLKISGIEISDS